MQRRVAARCTEDRAAPGATPSTSTIAARFAAMSIQRRSTRIAGIRLVRRQEAIDGLAHRLHLGRGEVGRVKRRREPAGDEEPVAIAQGDVELVGEVEHHLPARPRAAGLDEAEMARGDAGRVGEIELAQAPTGAPVSEELADRGRAGVRHGAHRTDVGAARSITSQGIDQPRHDAHDGPTRTRGRS